MPLHGFTPMFEKMLDHENIEVWTNTDCKDVIRFENGKIFLKMKNLQAILFLQVPLMSFLIVSMDVYHIVHWTSNLNI